MTKQPTKILSLKEIHEQLIEIVALYQKIPKKKRKKTAPKKKELVQLQETIDYLRVCTKYNLLDLESSQREIEYLKGLLAEGEK